MTHPDERDLPGARRAFADAVHALAGRTTTTITRDDGATDLVFGDPVYTQLCEYIAGAQGRGGAAGHARSMPPVVLEAIELRTEIDATVRDWSPGHPTTISALYWLAEQKKYRPQDVPPLQERAPLVEGWATQARTLLDPPRRWTLPAPCPACGAATIHRPDSAGEYVRQPALQIGDHGCECMACHTVWTPDLYVHLARVLGTMPDNVLE